MRFAVIGCGSMGKRRAMALRQLGYTDIVAVDPREERRDAVAEASGGRACPSVEAALEDGPDFALVCTPPHLHAACLMACIRSGVAVFCEAPLAMTLEEADTVIAAARDARVFLAPSCTYLHNGVHRRVASLLESGRFGRALAAVSHVGQHVADWHPDEDYRGFYASKRSQGGMGFDMLPHELHLFTRWFGPVRSLSCMARRRASDIETDTEAYDVYDVLLDMASGVSLALHQDVFQRPWGIYRKVLCERGVIEWNWTSLRSASYAGAGFLKEPVWEQAPLDGYAFEAMYVDEMRHALRAFEGREDYLLTPQEERRILEITLACEAGSRAGRHVSFKT